MSETTAPEDTDLLTSIAGAMDGLADVLDDDAAFDAPEEAEAVETPEAPAEEAAAADESEEVVAPEASADPLKDAQPFSYTVDGQAKTYDGIKVFTAPDGSVSGAVIPATSFAEVQYKIQRGEYLEGQNKTLYERTRQFDALEAKTPAGETVRGLDAVQHYVAENARLGAAVKILAAVLEDPEKLAAVYSDPREMQYLAKELSFAARDADQAARQSFGQRTTQHVQQETQDAERQAITTRSITASIDQWSSRYPALTPDDKAAVRAQLEQVGSALVRPATPAEAQQIGVPPGSLVINHAVVDAYLKDRSTLREQAQAAAKAAQAAAGENAAKLAATARGKTKAPAPTKGKRPTVPADEGETWAQQKARMMAGNFASDDD